MNGDSGRGDDRSEGPVDPLRRRQMMSGLALALGGANVIMQLSRLPIGRAVAESTVVSGSLFEHPLKRTRTTLGYIVIALFGTDHERDVVRREVGSQHALVRAPQGSPVAYSARDPELQLWVAACMYRGLEDAVTLLYGRPGPDELDELYQASSRFATTLQVPATSWPVDREAFERYWRDGLARVAMDDVTRPYLLAVASLGFLPTPLRQALGPAHRLLTAGFLPEPFRAELGLAWDERRQRRFDSSCRVIVRVNRVLPRTLREFPWNLALWDTRRRIRDGRPFV